MCDLNEPIIYYIYYLYIIVIIVIIIIIQTPELMLRSKSTV